MTNILWVPYAIVSIPLVIAFIYALGTYIASPYLVLSNLIDEFIPEKEEKLDLSRTQQSLVEQLFLGSTGKLPTQEEYNMFSGLSKSEIYELFKKLSSDSTLDYDPRYAIDDPLQFAD
jgi:hypothetical protein|tara:strand:- start:521 stop:874 length:354 start_codon:yes stop_codon:yes gene_type:complete